ncbi:MAG: lipoate--protein ligase family protein [Bacteroidales bacterium]|nr:lipoate--protein ligase family protein [Bacteroidales bacterium]
MSPLNIQTASNRITAVTFSPRLRCDPDSATSHVLAAIASLLVDMPTHLPVSAYAARIRAAVPVGCSLVGATIEDLSQNVATAVAHDATTSPDGERIGGFTIPEINHATVNWRHQDWQLISPVPCSPTENVAWDEVLADRVAVGQRPPTLRFWSWDRPTVVLGRCQSATHAVDTAIADKCGFSVTRRMSGGGAMLVTPSGTITYSLYLPESLLAGLSIRQSYEVCDAWAVRALRSLGVDCHYVPVNDIACGAGKIAGAAQARRQGVVLHHTTLAYDLDTVDMTRLLRLGQIHPNVRGVPSAAKVVSSIRQQIGHSREQVERTLMDTFQQSFGLVSGVISTEEQAEMRRLTEVKYGTSDWLHCFA